MGRYRWKWDPDNWPDQRINFQQMSRSQKRYTINQYNKQRIKQGIDPVPNPFDRAQNAAGAAIVDNDDGSETVTPKTPGRPPILPIGGQQAINNREMPPAIRGQGPIIDALRKQQILHPSSWSNQNNNDDIDDMDFTVEQRREMAAIAKFFETDDGQAVINSVISENNNAELAEFSGGSAPHRPVVTGADFDNQDGAGPSNAPDMNTRGQKRGNDGPQGGNSAPANPAEAVQTASATGTGHNSGSDGGFDSAQGPESFLPSGGYSASPGKLKFKKVHRLKSWAIPYYNLPLANYKSGSNLITTPLTKIPWEYAFFYLSPEEFSLLPAGSYIDSVHIRIMQTVATTGYPTGGSTASIATTNHPKVLCIGKDLEKKSRGGTDRVLGFTNEMIPSFPTANLPDTMYTDFINKQYGTDQTIIDGSVVVPGCAHKIPYYNNLHFCIYQPNRAQALARGFFTESAPGVVDENFSPGFEYFQNYITEMNSNDTTWDHVDMMSYKFESAPIGQQFPQLEILTDNVVNSTGNAAYYNAKRSITNASPNANTTFTESYVPSTRNTVPIVTYKSAPMEQGSYFVRGDSAGKPSRQPTYHIGMRAIDKQDPSVASTRASSFVQANIEFEIEATMIVNLPAYPNRFVKPKYYSTNMENTVMGIGAYPSFSQDRFITFGLPNETSTAPTVAPIDQVGNEETEDGVVTTPRRLRPRRHMPIVPHMNKRRK